MVVSVAGCGGAASTNGLRVVSVTGTPVDGCDVLMIRGQQPRSCLTHIIVRIENTAATPESNVSVSMRLVLSLNRISKLDVECLEHEPPIC